VTFWIATCNAVLPPYERCEVWVRLCLDSKHSLPKMANLRSIESLCLDHLDLRHFGDTGRKAHKIGVWPSD